MTDVDASGQIAANHLAGLLAVAPGDAGGTPCASMYRSMAAFWLIVPEAGSERIGPCGAETGVVGVSALGKTHTV